MAVEAIETSGGVGGADGVGGAAGAGLPDGGRGAGKALYRRYRPQTFEEVIGQEHVTGPLMQALRTGRFGHAYLFSGPRGCGKTTSARILARCLNCEQGPTATPCGECASCVALATGGSGSVDVIEIDAASHGGVDDARDLREKASYGPAQSRYKVYIIDEAHMVTPQGFNALLKIVEEPPEHVKFVFATTEPEKVIGTIRSRTHHYPFRLVPPARLQEYLAQLCEAESIPVEPGALSFVIRAGGGSVRDSLSVLDQLMAGSTEEGLTYAGAAALLGFTEGELLDATIGALAARDGAGVFRQVDRTIETGQDPRRFVEDLLERLRDLIVVAAVGASGGDVSALFRGLPSDQIERMRQQAAAFGPGELSHAADVVNTGLTEMTGATSPRLQLELICARLLLPASAGEHGIVARVDRIERRLDLSGTDPVGPPPRTVRPDTRPQGAAPVVSSPHAEAGADPASGQGAAGRSSEQSHGPASHAQSVDARGDVGAGRAEALRLGQAASAPEASGARGTPGADAAPRTDAPRSTEAPRSTDVPRGADVQRGAEALRGGDSAHGASGAPGAPGAAGGVGHPGAAAGASREAASPAQAAAAHAPEEARRAAGGLDTDAIRRSWPDVLAKVFSIRRVTWTFLSEHAQVLDYDGSRLLLGISTRGLATTFRGGQHAEVVRQALIEAIGLDTRVEAIPADEARGGGPGPSGGPGPTGSGPGSPGPSSSGPSSSGPGSSGPGSSGPGSSGPGSSGPGRQGPGSGGNGPGRPGGRGPSASDVSGPSASVGADRGAGTPPDGAAPPRGAAPAGGEMSRPRPTGAAPVGQESAGPRQSGGPREHAPQRGEGPGRGGQARTATASRPMAAGPGPAADGADPSLTGLRADAEASRGAQRATGWQGGDDAPDWAQVEPPHDDDAWLTPPPQQPRAAAGSGGAAPRDAAVGDSGPHDSGRFAAGHASRAEAGPRQARQDASSPSPSREANGLEANPHESTSQRPTSRAPAPVGAPAAASSPPAASTPASAPSSAPTDTSATASPAGASPDEPPTGGSVTPVAAPSPSERASVDTESATPRTSTRQDPPQTPSEGLGSGALAAQSPGPAVAERDGHLEGHLEGQREGQHAGQHAGQRDGNREAPAGNSGIAAFRRARADQARRAQAGLSGRPGAKATGAGAAGPEQTGRDTGPGDDEVSEDDEVIEDLNAVGQPVIASVLGGVVIGEDTT